MPAARRLFHPVSPGAVKQQIRRQNQLIWRPGGGNCTKKDNGVLGTLSPAGFARAAQAKSASRLRLNDTEPVFFLSRECTGLAKVCFCRVERQGAVTILDDTAEPAAMTSTRCCGTSHPSKTSAAKRCSGRHLAGWSEYDNRRRDRGRNSGQTLTPGQNRLFIVLFTAGPRHPFSHSGGSVVRKRKGPNRQSTTTMLVRLSWRRLPVKLGASFEQTSRLRGGTA